MAQDEDGLVGRQLVLDEGGYLSDDLRRGTCEAFVRRLLYAAAPAALVETERLDAVGGQVVQQFSVPADVVAEAMDEDELGADGDRWLVASR